MEYLSTGKEFIKTAQDVMIEQNNFELSEDEVELYFPEVIAEIGRTLGRNKSKDTPFGFRIYDEERDITYLSAKVSYRPPESDDDEGNFGISVSMDNNLPNFTQRNQVDYLDYLESRLRRKFGVTLESRAKLSDFVIGVFGSIFKFLMDHKPENDNEYTSLDFKDHLIGKIGWKKGKPVIKFTPGSEVKKRIKSDADLVS